MCMLQNTTSKSNRAAGYIALIDQELSSFSFLIINVSQDTVFLVEND